MLSTLPHPNPWAWPPWTVCSSPTVWLATQNHSTLVTERSAVPFLPVNPEYSATRNQVGGLGGPGPASSLPGVASSAGPAFLTSYCLGLGLGLGLGLLFSTLPKVSLGPAGTATWAWGRNCSFEHLVSSFGDGLQPLPASSPRHSEPVPSLTPALAKRAGWDVAEVDR